MQFYLLNIRPS